MNSFPACSGGSSRNISRLFDRLTNHSQHFGCLSRHGDRQFCIEVCLSKATFGGDFFYQRHWRPGLVLSGSCPTDVPERDHVSMDQGEMGVISDLTPAAGSKCLVDREICHV